MARSRYQHARFFKTVRRVAGNYTLTSGTWAAVDGANLDITLPAEVGDVIEYGISGVWGAEAQHGRLDVATLPSALGNYFSTGGAAPAGNGGVWYGESQVTNLNQVIAGSEWYTLQAGDLTAAGTVVLRLMALVSGTKTLYGATADWPLFLFAANLGPADPN